MALEGEFREEGLAEGDEEAAEEDDEENVSQAIIILHPGSSTLHLGLSTDPTPHSIPHIIAYRNVQGQGTAGAGTENGNGTQNGMEKGLLKSVDESLVLKYSVEMTAEVEIQREEGLASIMGYLDDCRVAASMLNYNVDRAEYVSHNGRVQPVARDSDDLTLTDVTAKPKYVIGNDVLYLPSEADYSLLKPMRHLTLKDPSLSLSRSNILSMLEDLWTKAVEDYLEIPRKEFKFYRVILVVPDIIERPILKELMNLLLLRMEFAAAFLHQESVCAAYCAGLSSACIVNTGDETTNICCVEDGMSNPNTRLMLRYGGSDITRLLHWLLQQTNFPYKECSEESRLSGVLVQHLKESICHMDPTVWGVKDYQFSVMTPTPGILHDYEIKLSDEAILAPLGVFFPQIFCLPPNVALMRGQEVSPADNEDIFDEAHWMAEMGGAGGGAQNKISADGVGVGGAGGSAELPEVTKRLQGADEGLVFGLDQAVHLSIDCASSLEMKQKLYGGIVMVGGGLAFPGAANLLQSRLEQKPLTIFPRTGNNIEVFANPRDLDSSFVVWKGGAVLSCLDTGQELWIEKSEWEFSGVRLLRERAPFSW